MDIIREIHSQLTKEDIVNILQQHGINAKIKGNFRIRNDDKNPSTSLYERNGKIIIKDFSGYFQGDIIDCLVEVFKYDKQSAVKTIIDYFGGNIIPSQQKYNQPFKEEKQIKTHNELVKLWESYEVIDFSFYKANPQRFKELINELLPLEYYRTASDNDRKEFLKRVRYDPQYNNLKIAVYKPNGEFLTFRYKNNGKWYSIKDTEANKYSQIRIIDPSEPIYILEGTHDYINAVLLGINFIAKPTKRYIFKDEELEIFKEHKYTFIWLPDLDKNLKKERDELLKDLEPLDEFTNEFQEWNLQEEFYYLKDIKKVKDFTDLLLISDIFDAVYIKVFLLNFTYIANNLTLEDWSEIYRKYN